MQAWVDEGVVPREDAEKIAANASFVTADIDRYQIKVHHDTHAFLQSVGESLGPESRWVHHGLTTNDVWDTASALQIRAAAELLERDHRAPRRGADAPGERIPPHGLRRADARNPRGTDDVRSEAAVLGRRSPPQPRPAGRRQVRHRGGQNLGRGGDPRDGAPMGRGPRVRGAPPRRGSGFDAGGAARPARALRLHAGAGRGVAGALRHGDSPPATHRGARGAGAVHGGPGRLVGDAGTSATPRSASESAASPAPSARTR